MNEGGRNDVVKTPAGLKIKLNESVWGELSKNGWTVQQPAVSGNKIRRRNGSAVETGQESWKVKSE